jgi:Kef-type K+ transport system membrane component KefB
VCLLWTSLATAEPGRGAVATVASISHQVGLLRVVLGLTGALVLAIVAAHPAIRRLERKLGLTVIIASGLPFLVLGVVFRLPSVGVLSDEVLRDLRPALDFGLGWLGFVVGMHFDVRELDRLPEKTGAVVVSESALPFLTVTIITAVVLLGLDGSWGFQDVHSARDLMNLVARSSLRDALTLGACAAPAAPVAAVALALSSGNASARLVRAITTLNDVAGVFVMALICAFYRPTDQYAAWQLPHIAWLFVTLGLGGVCGILTYILIRSAGNPSQEIALLLGATAISAGMSGYLGISPLVTCSIAGALLTNLPFSGMARIKDLMRKVENPLYLIFLLVGGALWDPTAWQGWLLAPVFLIARLSGKLFGAHIAKRTGPAELPDPVTLALALAPQSPIAIATVVGYAVLYKPMQEGASLSWLMTACIGSAVMTEIAVQIIARIRGELKFDARSSLHSIACRALSRRLLVRQLVPLSALRTGAQPSVPFRVSARHCRAAHCRSTLVLAARVFTGWLGRVACVWLRADWRTSSWHHRERF